MIDQDAYYTLSHYDELTGAPASIADLHLTERWVPGSLSKSRLEATADRAEWPLPGGRDGVFLTLTVAAVLPCLPSLQRAIADSLLNQRSMSLI